MVSLNPYQSARLMICHGLLIVLLSLAPQVLAEISIHASISNPSPWVREEVLLTLEVVDDRSMLEMQLAPWSAPGFSLRPLSPSVERIKTDQGIRILHRQHWAVMPLYAQAMSLHAPSVELRATGQGRFSLTPAPLSLNVRPLNPLLPVDVPVSRLHVVPTKLPDAVPRARPFNLSFTVQGSGLSVRGLRHWLEQSLHDTGELRIYPPEIHLVDNPDPAQPLLQVAEIRLTLEAQHSGQQKLPAITLPFVDPENGQIQHASLPAHTLRVEHPLWLALRPWLPWGIGGIALIFSFIGLWKAIFPRWQTHRQHRTWLREIQAADSPKALRKVWQNIPITALHDLTQQLDAACYGSKPFSASEFEALKARLVEHYVLRPPP